MAESGVECFSGVKTAQKSKTEGGIERIKHENVKLKEENVPGAILPREKPEECTVKQFQRLPLCRRKENAAGYVLPLAFYKMPDQGSSRRYLCRKAHNNLHVST